MTRGPADSLDTVDSAPTGETEPINEAVIAALADAGIDIDPSTEDERAVALLAERSAAGPPYPPELVAALSEFTQFPGDETATLDALAALGVGVGAHSSSDDDSD